MLLQTSSFQMPMVPAGRRRDGVVVSDQRRTGEKSSRFHVDGWKCHCGKVNGHSRTSCVRCGAKRIIVRRRREGFWKGATAKHGPVEVARELAAELWWVQPRPDLDKLQNDDLVALARRIGLEDPGDDLRTAIAQRYDKFACSDDTNFVEPTFNPKIKDLAPCYPEIYEPDYDAVEDIK